MEVSERRVIAHLDADAFYASVHLLEDPSLRGKPVVVAGSGPRSIVTTASYEARAFGVHSAQPAARARQLCPHAVFIRPEFDVYRAYSRRAMELIGQVSDLVEPLSLDEAYLDISAVEHPVRAMRELVAQIQAEVGLRYSVGIGPNKLCAKVLSDHRKPAAFNVASREQCCELFAEQSPRLIPGIGPKSVERLEQLGFTTIRSLRDGSIMVLARHFGERRAHELRARAEFHHDGQVQVRRERKSMSEERTFDVDVEDHAELAERLTSLAEELCGKLQQRELRARTVTIKVRLADFTTVTRSRTLPQRTAEPNLVSRIARELLAEYAPPQPVRLIGVGMSKFEDPAPTGVEERAPQLRLFPVA